MNRIKYNPSFSTFFKINESNNKGNCTIKKYYLQQHLAEHKTKKGFVHSTLWKFSTWWKFGLYFVYIFIVDWNFLAKFCSSDPSFNGNILTSLYLKSKTSTHAQLCDYSFIYAIYKFHGMVLAGNSHWGYLLISGVYR